MKECAGVNIYEQDPTKIKKTRPTVKVQEVEEKVEEAPSPKKNRRGGSFKHANLGEEAPKNEDKKDK